MGISQTLHKNNRSHNYIGFFAMFFFLARIEKGNKQTVGYNNDTNYACSNLESGNSEQREASEHNKVTELGKILPSQS